MNINANVKMNVAIGALVATAAATAAIAIALFVAAGCSAGATTPADNASAGAGEGAEHGFEVAATVQTVLDRAHEAADTLERSRAQAKELAEAAASRAETAKAARAEQERISAWRARFPLDDYSGVLLIGDSIMQNTSSALRSAMPGVDINADSGRTLETGGLVFEKASPDKGVLDHVRNDDGSHARYVIGTGNNDYGGMPLSAAEEIVERLGAGKEIYFVTEIVTGNSRGTATTNASIADVVARYPNVHAIDWHGLVEGRETEYLSDGCHPRADHYGAYAACIKDGLDEVHSS